MFAHRLEMTTTSSALLGKHFDVIRFHTIAHRGLLSLNIWRHQSSQTRTPRTVHLNIITISKQDIITQLHIWLLRGIRVSFNMWNVIKDLSIRLRTAKTVRDPDWTCLYIERISEHPTHSSPRLQKIFKWCCSPRWCNGQHSRLSSERSGFDSSMGYFSSRYKILRYLKFGEVFFN